MQSYIVGSDKKTVKIIADLITNINKAIDDGDLDRAEELIRAGTNTPNIPFRMELIAQCKALDLPV